MLVTLVVMDGYGINKNLKGNAIANAHTPNLDRFYKEYPNTTLKSSGMAVGLPEGQMGNSEVGHLNIGAGRVVYQEFARISKSIEDGDFYTNEVLVEAVDNAIKHNSALHIMGLLSDGGVHSHITHLYALLKLAKDKGLDRVYVHAFLDGRDVPPACANEYITALEKKMAELGVGRIATVEGRYYAMDRDKRWERVKLAYDAIVDGIGIQVNSAVEAVNKAYERGETDEFVKPSVVMDGDKPTATVSPNDSIVFFNFRPDRARQLTRSFIYEDFDSFERRRGYIPVYFVTMTQYDETFGDLVHVAFEPIKKMENTLGEYLSKNGIKQLRIAETEKYAHVTFFFNGGIEEPNENEDRVLIPSPKVPTYDLKPEMSAYEVTDELVKRIKSKEYQFILVNYANCDMVGHTGVYEAAVKAIEAVDQCLGRVVDAVREQNGVVFITADHGNAEQMIDYETGEPMTAHTTNVVPFIAIGVGDVKLREGGKLADIAPTVLDVMGLAKPKEMTGESLIIK
ncbi:phosphoglycerate mutase [Caldanaerobius fijiensis DSM 17918]|uniref:2,3-bisphosphoglycerate-independent phosphoglycerate mutase n=2 Tax=Caldanaerobius TaxID=862261 RepID=A0A1M5CSZ1_9THEO|nr:phosphoglycerate mutase [Caldanaerobius fijiensis DSM 17918]